MCPVAGKHGGVAQLARALGSYPGCHRFKSSRRYQERKRGALPRRVFLSSPFPTPSPSLKKGRPPQWMRKRNGAVGPCLSTKSELSEAGPILRGRTAQRMWSFRPLGGNGTERSRSDDGPVVKRLRLRPFTAATRVRVPSGSPFIWRLSSAGRALASHARGHRFEFCSLHQGKAPDLRQVLFQPQTGSCLFLLFRLWRWQFLIHGVE